MVPLRILGLGSNVLFFVYGLYGGLLPILLLHGFLFPLNALRLYQAARLRRRIHELVHTEFDVQSLLPFMTEKHMPKGQFLFECGDTAHEILYLAQGRAHIVELDIDIEAGNLIGEIAMFAPERRRTQTVVCSEDCVFLCIEEETVLQIYTENPEFGLFLIKMIVARLLTNNDKPVKEHH